MSLNEKEMTSHENSHGIKVPLQTPLGISRISVTSSGLIRPLMSIGSFWCWQKCQHNHYLYHRHHHHDHGPHCTWCQLGRAGSSEGRQQCQDPQSGLPLPWGQSSMVSQMLWIYVQRIDHKVVFFNLNIQIPGFPSECEKTGAESIRIGCFRLIFAVVKNVPGMVKSKQLKK